MYYFFLCLCKSFKELSFLRLAPIFSAKADAKVRLIFQPTKLFPNYFAEKQKVFAFFYNAKTLYLIIIYKKRLIRRPLLYYLHSHRSVLIHPYYTDYILVEDRKQPFRYSLAAYLYKPSAYTEQRPEEPSLHPVPLP